MFVQATIAILILVGFESVTSMGGEAKNAKRDVPIAVIVSLLVQGCFLLPVRVLRGELLPEQRVHHAKRGRIGGAHRRHDDHGRQRDLRPRQRPNLHAGRGFTVFLAIIGTTLSCMNTGARVTYAMGKDEEVPEHSGMLHPKNLTPHRAIWTLADHLGGGRLRHGRQ